MEESVLILAFFGECWVLGPRQDCFYNKDGWTMQTGENGLCSHLETTASIKRRRGLESCNLTVESLELKVKKCCMFYSGIAFRGSLSIVSFWGLFLTLGAIA